MPDKMPLEKNSQKAAREERLAAKLRENLVRRKSRERAVKNKEKPDSGT